MANTQITGQPEQGFGFLDSNGQIHSALIADAKRLPVKLRRVIRYLAGEAAHRDTIESVSWNAGVDHHKVLTDATVESYWSAAFDLAVLGYAEWYEGSDGTIVALTSRGDVAARVLREGLSA